MGGGGSCCLLLILCCCITNCYNNVSYIDEEITQSKLNLIQWKKNDKERDVRLKEEMSVKWKEMGQNVGISDAVLQGYRGDNIECMDKVITKWKTKGHKKVF